MERQTEPIRYIGGVTANMDVHHGQLRPVVGVQNRQVTRANRQHPNLADGYGWTYNHAPMLAYWNDTFYLMYLSNPVGEHVKPGQSFLIQSEDGIRWSKPEVVFPIYKVAQDVVQPDGRVVPAGTETVMHQRMGFYLAPNGKMLVVGFHGICLTPKEKPVDGRGIGRIVRELHADGTFGPLYFIRYNRHAGWDEDNTHYPFYKEATEPSFIEACDALLADSLVTMQWWEEDRSPDEFYAVRGYQAFNSYKRADGQLVGLWKASKVALSSDQGKTWSEVQHVPSLIMAGGKMWGEKTSDNRYALIYNPSPVGMHRWPLALVHSDDGETFDNMLVVNGDIPPRRYVGEHKNYGHSYMRGIEAGNGTPPRDSLWLAYSANKEDQWIGEIPVPIRETVDDHVQDDFTQMDSGGYVKDWNIYSLLWAPVEIVKHPETHQHCLMLADEEPSDYAKAERVFPERAQVTLNFTVQAKQANHGELYIEVCDKKTASPIRLWLDGRSSTIRLLHRGQWVELSKLQADVWYTFDIHIDAEKQRFTFMINGEQLGGKWFFAVPAYTVERLVFRTGPMRCEPTVETDLYGQGDLLGMGERVAKAIFYINEVNTAEYSS